MAGVVGFRTCMHAHMHRPLLHPASASGRRPLLAWPAVWCRSKYDMFGQAVDALAVLPKDLQSGKWSLGKGRLLK
jgi:hypothetical protein